MAKRKHPIEIETEIDAQCDQIYEAVRVLNKLRRSFHRLDEKQRERLLDLLEWTQVDLEECYWHYYDKQKEIVEAQRAKEAKKSGEAKPPRQKTSLPPLSEFLAPFFDRMALNMEAISEGMPIALEKRRQRQLEEEGRFDWPDAIDTEGGKVEHNPKQLPPKKDETDS